MKQKRILPYVGFVLLSFAAGGLAALAVMRGMPAYRLLDAPPLTPPPMIFGLVWGVLYLLIGVSAGRVWNTADGARNGAIALFVFQLIWNALWSVWFFALEVRFVGLLWLLALIVVVVWLWQVFRRIDRAAGLLLVPYLLWCCFAAYLNWGFWWLNR